MWYKLKRIMMRPNEVEKQVRPTWKPTWRLDQATHSMYFDTGSGSKYWVCISKDGDFMYVGNNAWTVLQYSLSTPFDVTTATYVTSVTWVSSQHWVYISPNGLKLFAVWHDNSTVKEYTLQSANNLTGATSTNVSLPRNWWTWICFNSDWTKCIIWRYSNSMMFSLNCQTPYSLVWATEITTKSLWFQDRWLSISKDGLHIFLWNEKVMRQRDLTTKDDISTASSSYSYTTDAAWIDDYAWTITEDWRYFYYITDARYVNRLDMPWSY